MIVDALTKAHPDTYPQILAQAMESKKLTASQALCFILSPQARNTLGTLRKTNEQASEWTRDQRLKSWLDTCIEAGGTLEDTLLPLHDNSGSLGKAAQQLMKIKAFATLDTLREIGLEAHLRLPHVPGPATLFELALHGGLLEPAKQLDRGAPLAHGEVLWRRIWVHPCVKHIEQMVEILQKKNIPSPDNLLDSLPRADINLNVIDRVLKTADRLLDQGLAPPSVSDKERTPLGQALENLTSPAGVEVVDWLIARGHDPTQPTRVGAHKTLTTPLEACLKLWHNSSLRDQKRAQFRAVAEKLCGYMDSEKLAEIFNSASIKTYEDTLRQKLNGSLKTKDEYAQVQGEIAWMKRLGLRYMVRSEQTQSTPVRRLAM